MRLGVLGIAIKSSYFSRTGVMMTLSCEATFCIELKSIYCCLVYDFTKYLILQGVKANYFTSAARARYKHMSKAHVRRMKIGRTPTAAQYNMVT